LTCIAACKIDGKVFIGSDSQIHTGGVKESSMRKITMFPHFAVGVAGDYAIHKFLESVVDDPSYHIKITKEWEARQLAKRVLEEYKSDEKKEEEDDPEEGESTSEKVEMSLIIATPHSIYEVDECLLSSERGEMSSIGTGATYAKAAMQVMLEEKLTNDGIELLNKALRIAAANDLYSGLPVYVFEVKEALPPQAET